MVVNLQMLDLDCLVKVPLVLNDYIFDVAPNRYNEVYVFNGGLIHNMRSNNLNLARYNLLRCPVRISDFLHHYKNIEGDGEELRYWGCEISDKLPDEISSAFFYHGFVEIWALSNGISRQEAHDFAVEETEKYVDRCFDFPDFVLFDFWNEKLIDESPKGIFIGRDFVNH